jgi:hypothetical protein
MSNEITITTNKGLTPRGFFERRIETTGRVTDVATTGGNELDAMVNEILGITPVPQVPTLPFLGLCSVKRIGFLVLAERYGHELRMYGNETEIPDYMKGTVALEEMGEFSFEWSRWPGCPLCGAGLLGGSPFWWSRTCRCKGKFHCNGTMLSGERTCICGVIHGTKFTSNRSAAVTGLLPGITILGQR